MILAFTAAAADVSAGVVLGAGMDLPDKVSGDYAKFGVGPVLELPVFVGLGEGARLRFVPSAQTGFGSDRVSWVHDVDGAALRFYDDDHWAMAVVGGLAAGIDALAPGATAPYAGASLGIAWVGTYHSFGGSTQLLLDPDQNELDNPGNIDPYTTQIALSTGLHAGLRRELSDRLAVQAEVGYSVAFLKERELRKSPPELSARREAYGWNPLRLGVGLTTSF